MAGCGPREERKCRERLGLIQEGRRDGLVWLRPKREEVQAWTGPPRPSAGGPGAKEKIESKKKIRKREASLFLGIFQRLKKKNKQAQSNSNNFQANANAHDVALWFILCYLAQKF